MAEFRARPTRLVRQLRNNATDTERFLWARLCRRQLGGCKFSHPIPVAGFICDFFCRELRLILKVDGGQHDALRIKDYRRSALLEREGFQVLRFWNNEVLGKIEGMLQAILQSLPQNLPLPQAGGERRFRKGVT